MSTWPWWTPCAPTAPWGPSWSPRPRYCSRTGAFALGQTLCPVLLTHLGCFRGTHLPPRPLSRSPGGVRGGREAGADLLQEGGAAGDRACGEHERLCLPPLLGESWAIAGMGSQLPPPRPPPASREDGGGPRVSVSQECTNVFSKGGGEELARHAGVPFLGEWAGAATGPCTPRGEGASSHPADPLPCESCQPQAPCACFCKSTREAAGPAGRLLGVLGRLSPGMGPAGPWQCCPWAPGLRGWTGPPNLALTAHSPPPPRLGAPGPRAHAEPGGWPGLHPGLPRQSRLPRALLHRPEDSQRDACGALLTEAG